MGYLKDGNGSWSEAPDESAKIKAAEAALAEMRTVDKADLMAVSRAAVWCGQTCRHTDDPRQWAEFVAWAQEVRSSCEDAIAELRKKRAGLTARQRLYSPLSNEEHCLFDTEGMWEYWQ